MDSSIDQQALLKVLEDVRLFTSESEDSGWAHTNLANIDALLDLAINELQNGRLPNLSDLRLLFAPTGSLQETSLSNGWANTFLMLAEEFDRIIGQHS